MYFADEVAGRLVAELQKRLGEHPELGLGGFDLQYDPNTGPCFYGIQSGARMNRRIAGTITLFYDDCMKGVPVARLAVLLGGVMPYADAEELGDMRKVLGCIEESFKALGDVKCRIYAQRTSKTSH